MLTQPPGIFSSRVSSNSVNEILITGRDCDVDLPNKESMDFDQFGLNAGPHVSVQVTEHCAPIVTAGYSNSSVDPARNNVNFTSYNYGGGYFNASTFEVANNSTSHTSQGTGNYDV